MNKAEECNLILCDEEEEYAHLMSEFLKKQKNIPWKVYTYTNRECLWNFKGSICLLVVAENAFSEDMRKCNAEKIVILNESGLIKWGQYLNINKYRAAEDVYRELLDIYTEMAGQILPILLPQVKTRFIGIYSPVKRCMQTCFALTMGQILSENHSVLYLNFEHYAGDGELLITEPGRDLSDLLFFLSAKREKFRLRFQTAVRRKGNMDYIPPVRAGQTLLTVPGEEWVDLLNQLVEMGEYEYVIMDLSDSIQGLFDLLRMCHKVFTITKNDRLARGKLLQYEQLLQACAYEDVLSRTVKCSLPHLERLPESIDQYARGDLVEYIKRQLESV